MRQILPVCLPASAPQILNKITNRNGNRPDILNHRHKQIITMQEIIIAINHHNNKTRIKALQFNIKAVNSFSLII
ncbi:TPA: hypothetical protein ACWYFB_002698, partial [Morganella morganii]